MKFFYLRIIYEALEWHVLSRESKRLLGEQGASRNHLKNIILDERFQGFDVCGH